MSPNSWLISLFLLTFTLGEVRLHLRNTKKNKFSFGISLGLHYLCTLYDSLYSRET